MTDGEDTSEAKRGTIPEDFFRRFESLLGSTPEKSWVSLYKNINSKELVVHDFGNMVVIRVDGAYLIKMIGPHGDVISQRSYENGEQVNTDLTWVEEYLLKSRSVNSVAKVGDDEQHLNRVRFFQNSLLFLDDKLGRKRKINKIG